MRAQMGDVAPLPHHPPAAGRRQADDRAHGRGLADAVAADQRDALAGMDLQRHAERRSLAERHWDEARDEESAGRLALAEGREALALERLSAAVAALDRTLAVLEPADTDLHEQAFGRLQRLREEVRDLSRRQEQQRLVEQNRRAFQERLGPLARQRDNLTIAAQHRRTAPFVSPDGRWLYGVMCDPSVTTRILRFSIDEAVTALSATGARPPTG